MREYMRIVSVDDARERLLSALGPRRTAIEEVPLEAAGGRVLAEGAQADIDVPNHPRSAVDGYALQARDTFGASEGLPAYLTVAGEVFMGRPPETGGGPGFALKIPTGGMLPDGTDAVVMLEHATLAGDEIEVRRPVAPGDNVIRQGEDIPSGGVAARAGTRLRPADVGLLAAAGLTRVKVFARPRALVISTGDEVVPPSARPNPAQVRDSNGPALIAALRSDGCVAEYAGILPDRREAFDDALRRGLQFDAVLISGGSSVGARDLAVAAIEACGRPGLLVHGVSLKPGKPTGLAVVEGRPIFAIPGHPVSALIVYRLFVRPALRRLAGLPAVDPWEPRLTARLGRNVASAPGRDDYVRVRLEWRDGERWAEPVLGKSGLLSTLGKADGLLRIPPARDGFAAGEQVEIIADSPWS